MDDERPLLPTEPTTFTEYRVACFQEIGQLLWALQRHAECAQGYADLCDARGIEYALECIKSCYLRATVLRNEVTSDPNKGGR